MSFSREVKEELAKQTGEKYHCQLAELAAIYGFCGALSQTEEGILSLAFQTENEAVARKCFTLLKKAFNIESVVEIRNQGYQNRTHHYSVVVPGSEDVGRLLKAFWPMVLSELSRDDTLVHPYLVQRDCCRRAFIRGAFLCVGSVTDPNRFYHLEFVCGRRSDAEQLRELLLAFDLEAKIALRKRSYVLYIKEGDQLVDLLNVMGAHLALMELENIRIRKEVRNTVNRLVNCDSANIQKTVTAAQEQIRDIQYLRDIRGLEELPRGLAEIARLRLEQPQATLKELGEMTDPPVGKSGVNHRLKKLQEMAEQLRHLPTDSKG